MKYVTIIYEFYKIDNSDILRSCFYVGSYRSKLIQIVLMIIEDKHVDKWREWCHCEVIVRCRWDILKR